jgi:SPP1 gp7 family putative phage head morphogenesis protein
MANKFSATKTTEKTFAIQLRKVAKIVGGIIDNHVVGNSVDNVSLNKALISYSKLLIPWANNLSEKTIQSISKRNEKAFMSTSQKISRRLLDIFTGPGVGEVARKLQNEQVALITSLPIEAAQKAQEISRDAVITGTRADVTAKKILDLGEITESRATLIARTETAKANTALTVARATAAGSKSFIWRTAGDADVRESHRVLDGKIFEYADPPFVSPEEGSHLPGDIWNCRCYAEPIFTD